ncbi:MAG: lipopolysaccharide transport system ATP-binding protein [Sphingomonadales bacterium]|jgi:ABC-type polysaccharide/polyol phosphate transport system ATPase subunit|nr:lipopolysaccharide transport system ATP-binding protein [Sphingomonadales bacterium]
MSAIVLDRVGVRFPLFGARARQQQPGASLSVGGAIAWSGRGRASVVALDGVSLTLRDGDRVGIIGHNGSGKSTLLRVVGGVYEPCRGSLHVSGRVLSLFDPMLGMSTECTGRENVVLRGIFVGRTPRQALTKLDEIAEFSELGAYMDLPLKTYSTGMQLRLAFSIATAFEAEILLLDEQFMAGDAAFMEKAERRLKAFVARAGIVVQASHSEQLIRDTCTKVVLLEKGRLAMAGEPGEVFARYRETRAAEAVRAR